MLRSDPGSRWGENYAGQGDTAISPIPRALAYCIADTGAELDGDLVESARLIVAGTLAPGSRFRYGWELGNISQWCGEHGLDLLDLSPVDMGALVVAYRDAEIDPKTALSALSFVYRHKAGPSESATGLALRVDKVWKKQNRDRRVPVRRAQVLPLQCWRKMYTAVSSTVYLRNTHGNDEERLARDRLVISLGVSAGLRSGEFGQLSASKAHIDSAGRLVLPLLPGHAGATTKTGRPEIVVPLGVPPFDAFPIAEDLEELRRLRLARPGGDDHLVGGAWHYGMTGGLSASMPKQIWRKAAFHAGIAGGESLTGHSARRSMVHICVAAGWSLEQIAAVTGHVTTKEIEKTYLEGYGGSWCRSSEGRELLLSGVEGWADCPLNIAARPVAARGGRGRWWEGRDLDADRDAAVALARSTPRVGESARRSISLIGRRWEEFCGQCGADSQKPSQPLLEGFAISMTKDTTAYRHNDIRFLEDYLVSLPTTNLGDISQIRQWAIAAAQLGGGIVNENRKQAKSLPKRRRIVTPTEEHMSAVFAQPLLKRTEAVRLIGLVLEQGEAEAEMSNQQRAAFRFGEHARVGPDTAELLVPAPTSKGDAPVSITVARRGGDPLWCGYEAVRSLIAHFPDMSLRRLPEGALASRCTSLIRWLQARAAVAVLYETGLRPSDLDGFRWPDLRAGDDGAIMWRLPYSKGNLSGDRVQVLLLRPSSDDWCPVRALQRLAESIRAARLAGWQGRTAEPDSDGTTRRVFCPNIGKLVTGALMEPAGVPVRPQDFRYLKAAQIWADTGDIQLLRAALFHRRAEVSMGYVARGMPAAVRAETDPLNGAARGGVTPVNSM